MSESECCKKAREDERLKLAKRFEEIAELARKEGNEKAANSATAAAITLKLIQVMEPLDWSMKAAIFDH